MDKLLPKFGKNFQSRVDLAEVGGGCLLVWYMYFNTETAWVVMRMRDFTEVLWYACVIL